MAVVVGRCSLFKGGCQFSLIVFWIGKFGLYDINSDILMSFVALGPLRDLN